MTSRPRRDQTRSRRTAWRCAWPDCPTGPAAGGDPVAEVSVRRSLRCDRTARCSRRPRVSRGPKKRSRPCWSTWDAGGRRRRQECGSTTSEGVARPRPRHSRCRPRPRRSRSGPRLRRSRSGPRLRRSRCRRRSRRQVALRSISAKRCGWAEGRPGAGLGSCGPPSPQPPPPRAGEAAGWGWGCGATARRAEGGCSTWGEAARPSRWPRPSWG
eukprot:scaffold9689_cov116-Isochrysis_galbana.AAC.11